MGVVVRLLGCIQCTLVFSIFSGSLLPYVPSKKKPRVAALLALVPGRMSRSTTRTDRSYRYSRVVVRGGWLPSAYARTNSWRVLVFCVRGLLRLREQLRVVSRWWWERRFLLGWCAGAQPPLRMTCGTLELSPLQSRGLLLRGLRPVR